VKQAGIPAVPGGVPIVGSRVYMACSQGHVVVTSVPFVVQVPGEPPEQLQLCRVCWLQFMRMFGARPLVDEEIEALRQAGQLEGN
jgi:hypothetical protein